MSPILDFLSRYAAYFLPLAPVAGIILVSLTWFGIKKIDDLMFPQPNPGTSYDQKG